MNNNIIKAQDILNSRDWKNKNQEYLKQLQKFFDLADNISDERLKKQVIAQMLKCDEVLTRITEDICNNTCNKN